MAQAHPASVNGLVTNRNQAAGGAQAPALKVSFDPPNKVFYIAADTQMPRIKVTCTLPPPTPAASTALSGQPGPAMTQGQSFDWNVSLVLNPAGVPHAVGRVTRHAPIQTTTNVPQLTLPFTQVRGGTLTVVVTTTFENKRITGKATAEIQGTNPSSTLIRGLGATELQLQLMMLESGLKQFLTTRTKTGYPLFSHDGLGGVGLGQITHPTPSDDEVWNWKANVRAAIAQWNSKRSNDAGRLLRKYANGTAFKTLVAAYNKARTAAPAPAPAAPSSAPARPPQALTITLPAITDEMLDNETLRLYNGGLLVQEYVAEIDANGMLVVDVANDGQQGTARWHQVSAAERRAIYVANGKKAETGDPDYVNHVRAQVVP